MGLDPLIKESPFVQKIDKICCILKKSGIFHSRSLARENLAHHFGFTCWTAMLFEMKARSVPGEMFFAPTEWFTFAKEFETFARLAKAELTYAEGENRVILEPVKPKAKPHLKAKPAKKPKSKLPESVFLKTELNIQKVKNQDLKKKPNRFDSRDVKNPRARSNVAPPPVVVYRKKIWEEEDGAQA